MRSVRPSRQIWKAQKEADPAARWAPLGHGSRPASREHDHADRGQQAQPRGHLS